MPLGGVTDPGIGNGRVRLASAINVSGPIAIMISGLMIGNQRGRFAMSEKARRNLDSVWELLDEILNALLFKLIGLEVLVLTFSRNLFFANLLAISAILFSRWRAWSYRSRSSATGGASFRVRCLS